MKLGRGAVVVVALDPTVGHEQHGVRPCIVVSDPYPPIAPGQSGLTKSSFALIDQLRSIDKRRVRRVFGELAREEIAAIDEGLAAFLGLGGGLADSGAPVQ
ncbi:MAG: type II toxin-antitoxin system PemK/MazF family toxin [Acidobacteriia bacterium]|nr:type II toxin-antitoxin system PemK/MazF family toxin [Terriglobia bacterium]